jgi:hypothetical protein
MQEAILAVNAEKKRVADETMRLNAIALEKSQRELAKLGVPPDDPLMQAPKGPGPSCQEIREIQREFSAKPKKRKLGEANKLVRFPKFRPQTS